MGTPELNWTNEIDIQLGASLDMLKVAIETATNDLWDHPDHEPRFWKICVHITYGVDFYCSVFQPNSDDYDNYELPQFLHKYSKTSIQEVEEVIAQEDVLKFLEYGRKRLRKAFDSNLHLQFRDPSGFEWLPMNKAQLLLYNMRHIMEHTAILNQILKKHGLPASTWRVTGKI